MTERYAYIFPDESAKDGVGRVEMSRDDILQEYYPSWCELMRKAHKAHLISEDHCIDDWVTVHWAERIL